jgi:DNA-binding response OmpR family regulator
MSAPKIIVYSDDSVVRQNIVGALGKRVSADLPEHEILEFATGPALRLYLDQKGKADLFILDGEAVPEGGMGIARQLKDEIFNCPPVLLIVGRIQDNWLASWSRAEDVLVHPIDPFTFAKRVATLLKSSALANR